MANKYDELSNKIINLIGGQENISFFTHCITRLRFNLKDRSLTDITAIGKLKGVIGVQWQGDQLQIIIGQEVDDAYRQICLVNHLKEETEIVENLDPDLKKTKKKLNIKQSLLVIVDCMAPIFTLLIGASRVEHYVSVFLSGGQRGYVLFSNIPWRYLSKKIWCQSGIRDVDGSDAGLSRNSEFIKFRSAAGNLRRSCYNKLCLLCKFDHPCNFDSMGYVQSREIFK